MIKEILNLSDVFRAKCNLVNAAADMLHTPMHIHKEIEILMIETGTLTLHISNIEYKLGKGDIVVINEDVVHETLASFNESHYYLHFNFSTVLDKSNSDSVHLYSHIKDYALFSEADEHYNELKSFIMDLHSHYNESKEYSTHYIRGIFHQIFGFLQKIEFLKPYDAYNTTKSYKKIETIVNYINENYSEPLTLEGISSHFYLQPSYVCRLFKSNLGLTFTAYLNQVRIKKAEIMLVTTDNSILNISQNTGFSSQSYFNKVFKKAMTITPQEYRNRQFKKGIQALCIEI